MVKVIFECYENMNRYEEDVEFEEGVTNEEIEAEWKEWVWNQIGENFGWRKGERDECGQTSNN